MYGIKHTATGSLLAAGGLDLGWHAFAAATALFGVSAAIQLLRRHGAARP